MRGRIDLSIEGGVARLMLNNPERHNSLTGSVIGQLLDHLEAIEGEVGVRVLIITGAGNTTFCSGMSLSQIQSGKIDSDLFETLANRLVSLPIPKIAAMNGSAYGGGVEIGLCCDFRIGVNGMKAMVPAAKFGLCYPVNGIQRYVDRLGVGPAKRFLVAAEPIEAQDLLRIGYLQQVCEPDELPESVDELARRITELAPLAVSAMLNMCYLADNRSLNEQQAREWIDQCNASDDLQEGLSAALEKRKPEFRGR
jgi:enoyl-CoA hydratase/carnithine racemase